MALKDNWIDRQNGIDDVDSEDINKVARAVIEAEKRLDDVGIGVTFFPDVSESGIISWTNDGGLPNPPPINIKGDRGEKGDKGDKGDNGDRGEQGIQGEKGDDGYTPQKGVDYFTEADKQAMVQEVLNSLPDGDGVEY